MAGLPESLDTPNKALKSGAMAAPLLPDAPVSTLHGIGERRTALLQKLGIHCVRDLLLHIPVRHEDRTRTVSISELADGDTCSVLATAAALPAHQRPRKGLSIWRLAVTDGTGYLTITWFNQDFAVRNIRQGDRFLFYGTVKRLGSQIGMSNPVFERMKGQGPANTGLLPVYRLTEGVSQQMLRTHVREALHVLSPEAGDILPEEIRTRHGLVPWHEAVRAIHFPKTPGEVAQARHRLAFEELLELQVGMRVQRGASLRKAGVPIARHSLAPVLQRLPYTCTQAQTRVLEEILRDMERPVAMNRLLQGDVGSGKTVVALLAAYAAIQDGWQAALMVPTEILARQHEQAARELLEPLGVRVSLLTGGMRKRYRQPVLAHLAEGGRDLVIGTHALLVEDVRFHRLGLVITDEQHRFGVRQRAQLFSKGHVPHMLVMTATPIPRTLSLAVYGDLDVSVIDKLPPGRKPVRTYVVGESMRSRIEAFLRKTVREGRQVYVVCPLVDESEELAAESAEAVAARYRDQVFPDLRVGLLHGQMKPVDKDAVMQSFASGQVDVLVSTTVIEVGVNVPNACVMVVENAERFGLSQLHQLRGRVGRGADQSHCVLFQGGGGKTATERLGAIAATQDGFALAELDLKLRGPGEVLGVRQSGLPSCHIADPFSDVALVQAAREEAERLEGPLADPALRPVRNQLLARFAHRLRDISPN